MNTLTETQVRLFASTQSWIEGEGVRQLYATAKLDGVRCAVGFPDLHPGKGCRHKEEDVDLREQSIRGQRAQYDRGDDGGIVLNPSPGAG